jgi:hypothetical protein
MSHFKLWWSVSTVKKVPATNTLKVSAAHTIALLSPEHATFSPKAGAFG